MTRLLYREDPYLLEFDARVVERRTHEGRPAVVLDQTAFYAESGGQPWDVGLLEDVPVIAVLHQRDAVVHVLERALAADDVHGKVDEARRRDHRQQHHGQHLLSRALLDVARAPTTSFHLGETVSAIALLGSRHGGRAHLVFARSPGRTEDVVALLAGVLAIIGGRGGGRGDLAQGGGDLAFRLDEALAAAQAAASQPARG